MKTMKKIGAVALSTVFAFALCLPIASFAESSSSTDASDNATETNATINEADAAIGAMEEARGVANTQDGEVSMMGLPSVPEIVETVSIESVLSGDEIEAEVPLETTPPAADCTATVMYYENVTYEEPGVKPNEQNRYFLGKRTITGLTEGEVLNAWDYVANIPGFVFFDGWPRDLVVSANPEENIFEFFYFRLWNNAYTVNYYLMEGADLTADTWNGALAGDVTFTKFASETFENQPYGALVEGDAYEYKIDGTYVVDAYPAQIRVGTDTDNDIINVLYVPTSATLPDEVEVVEGTAPPNSGSGDVSGGGSDSATTPGGGTTSGGSSGGNNGSTGSGTSGGSSSSSGATRPSVPPDQTFERDEIAALLPDNMTEQEIVELFHDFIDDTNAEGELEITDEMLENSANPAQARLARAAFNTGYEQGVIAGENNSFSLIDHLICIILIIALLITTIIGFTLFGKERRRRTDLEKTLEKTQNPSVDMSES